MVGHETTTEPVRCDPGDVIVGDVDAVDHSCAWSEEAGAVEQLDRRAAVLGMTLVELASLFMGVNVAHESVSV